MDVTCAHCGEPWDSDHLLFDEVWEWGLPEAMVRDFNRNPRFGGPAAPVRIAAGHSGWQFAGASPLAILRCPSCEERAALPDADEREVKTRIAEQLLHGDQDGLIVELADL